MLTEQSSSIKNQEHCKRKAVNNCSVGHNLGVSRQNHRRSTAISMSYCIIKEPEVLLEAPAGPPEDDGPQQDGPGDGANDDVGATGPWEGGGDQRSIKKKHGFRGPLHTSGF